MPEAIAATKTSDGSCLDDNSCGSLSSYTISNESSTLCSDSDANKSLLSNIQGDNTLGEMSQEESTLNGGTTVDSSTIGESSGSVSMESSSVYTSLISGDSSTSSTQEDDEEEEDNTTISSITSPNFTRHPPIESSCEVSNVRDRSNNSDGSRSLFQHHALSTPPAPQPSMEPVDSITSRLLGLRGSPPGTLCSLAESEIKLLCQRVRPVLLNQQMLLELEAPLKICGDIHGQFTDLLRLFEYGGFPPEANYLFLGDYVDRGKQSLETICLLFCYKIKYPENFSILRGNHESAGINRIYGFYDECKRRYSIKLWKIFCDCFNCLPVSAIVDEKILCMHGGLSPEMHSLQQIADLPRPCDVPDVGLMCDLLWSDPDANINGWAENDRGVSFVFGADVVASLLERHDLDLLVRAHQVVEDGYEFFAGRRLVTLFSAPNYCGEFDNAGGMISVDENLMCSFQILKPSSRSARFASARSGGGNL